MSVGDWIVIGCSVAIIAFLCFIFWRNHRIWIRDQQAHEERVKAQTELLIRTIVCGIAEERTGIKPISYHDAVETLIRDHNSKNQ